MTAQVPAEKISRAAKAPTKADLQAELDALKAEKAAQSRVDAVSSEPSLPLEFELDFEGDADTLIWRSPRTGEEIHCQRPSITETKQLLRLNQRLIKLQNSGVDEKSLSEDVDKGLDFADALLDTLDEIGQIVFSPADNDRIKRAGLGKYQRLLGQALERAVGSGTAGLGN